MDEQLVGLIRSDVLEIFPDAVHDDVTALASKKRVLDNKILDGVIRDIVETMEEMPNYTRDCLPDVARDVISQYPQSFKDIKVAGKAGMGLATDCDKLIYKMSNRSDNTNRGGKSGLQVEAPDIAEASGCVRWAVLDLPEGEDEESLEEKIVDMQVMFSEVSRKEWDWGRIKDLSLTYGLQRADLNSQISTREKKRRRGNEEIDDPEEVNNKKTTDEIIERFPFLTTTRGINHHFHLLTNHHDFADDLIKWLEEVDTALLDYLATRHVENPKIRHQMRKAKERDTCKDEDAELMAIMLMLMNCLKEDQEGLIKFVLVKLTRI
ncbi:hypothetical protein ONE63_011080 [Megalurothrips usitatus]|uniref:Uncharacterized protein n=1 Tax=Megalurothrips usitatus TaxID=439358 RepID=A0AAV7XFY4_9NEOP|nr:hypothetical protein ONE63_011080 [Megalurothrips usitatus]